MSIGIIFSDGDSFDTILDADVVLQDITADILDVQFPDSRRGLNKSRNEVNNRVCKFIARCKVNHMNATDVKDKDEWAAMGKKAAVQRKELSKAKDAILTLENIW